MKRLLCKVIWLSILVAPAACGSATGAAVEKELKRGKIAEALAAYDRGKSRDLSLLGRIAGALLEREALGPDPKTRDAAIAELRLTGTAGRDLDERLADAKSPPPVRARALRILMELGDQEARLELRALLQADQPEVTAEAIAALDPKKDLKLMVEALKAVSAEQRLAAARSMAAAAPDAQARSALIEAARLDPSAEVRAAAATSLAGFKDQAAAALEEALQDREARVRLAAVGALARAVYDRAAQVFDKYLASDASAEGVEAARWLASLGGKNLAAADRARGFLRRVLSDPDSTLRAAAAVALQTLPSYAEDTAKLMERMQQEGVPSVRLWLALAALSRPDAANQARSVLSDLMKAGEVTGAEAAAELARRGESSATRELVGLQSRSAAARSVAARAIGRDLGRPWNARRFLADPELLVRIAAAGAILFATKSLSQ